MLRLFVLLLLFANGAYFAWSQGHLASLGFAPPHQSEPQRLQAQIKPDAIRLLSATEARRIEVLAAAPPPRAPECLQSAFLDAAKASAVRDAASSLPAGSWNLEDATERARWIVYMGKYSNTETLAKKKSELRELGIGFESLKNSSLEPGISLGVFATQAQASESMAKLAERGLRSAKVVQEAPERKGQLLKLPVVDDGLRAQLAGIKSVVGSNGLSVCKAI